MRLLFDLGNSRLKWAVIDADGKLVQQNVMDHRGGQFSGEDLIEKLGALPKVRSIWIASVAAENLTKMVAHSAEKVFTAPIFFADTSASAAFGVALAYKRPQEFGVDRFLSLLALRAGLTRPLVLAACGTALVLDGMDINDVHLGGLIIPSPSLMQSVLASATAKVRPDFNRRALTAMADNTEDAVYSGTWLAAAALVRQFVAATAFTCKADPDLILTGGDGPALQTALNGIGRIEEQLVLRGLSVYAQHFSHNAGR